MNSPLLTNMVSLEYAKIVTFNQCSYCHPISPSRRHSRDVHLLQLVSVVSLQLSQLWQGPEDETEDAEGPAGSQCALPSYPGLQALHGAWLQRGGWGLRTVSQACFSFSANAWHLNSTVQSLVWVSWQSRLSLDMNTVVCLPGKWLSF